MKMSEVREDFSQEIAEGKNRRSLKCKFCTSIILTPTCGNHIELKKTDLPMITQKKDSPSIETETIPSFWVVDDMFTFQNIGFSNSIDNKKYLACADCDRGPIGYHDLTTKKNYVAINRVDYV